MTIETGFGTGGRIVKVTLALMPPLVAVIVTVPGPTAVTYPLFDTVATSGSLLVHVTERPVRTLPSSSRATADARADSPACNPLRSKPIETDATGTALGAAPATVRFA